MARVRAEMPEDLPQRPRGWQVGVVGLVAIAAYVVVARALLGDVHPEQIGEVRATVGFILGELIVVAVCWTLRTPGPSLAVRAVATAFVAVPVIIGVVVSSLMGDLPGEYRWERLPGEMHAEWLGFVLLWSLALAVLVPIANRVVDAIRRRALRAGRATTGANR